MADRTTPFDPTVLDRQKHDDGGPAFPLPDGEFLGQDRTTGMSLRDYFAGQALVGLTTTLPEATNPRDLWPAMLAADAYLLADAMLAERAKAR